MNIKKIAMLSVALVATVLVASNVTKAQDTGDIVLTINTGTSACIYGTGLTFIAQDIDAGFGALTFDAAFNNYNGNNTWSCTDFDGTPLGWDLTISSSDLTNANSNVISGSNVLITHDIPAVTAGSCTPGGAAAADVAIDTDHTIIAKTPTSSVCTVTTDNVSLKVEVPANQAPGTYTGTLTVTLPTFGA